MNSTENKSFVRVSTAVGKQPPKHKRNYKQTTIVQKYPAAIVLHSLNSNTTHCNIIWQLSAIFYAVGKKFKSEPTETLKQ